MKQRDRTEASWKSANSQKHCCGRLVGWGQDRKWNRKTPKSSFWPNIRRRSSDETKKEKQIFETFFSFDGVGNEIEKSCGVLLRIDRRNSVHARAVLDGLSHLGRLLLDAVVRQDVHQSQEVDLSLLRGGPRWDRVDVFLGVDFSSRGGRGGLFRASGWPGAGQRRVRRG